MKYVRSLAAPLFALIFSNVLLQYMLLGRMPSILYTMISILVMIGVIVFAGWSVAKVYKETLWMPAYSGAFVFFIDYVVFKGSYIVAHPPETAVNNLGYLVLGGLISFLIYVPLAMALAAVGGWLARRP